MKSSSRRFGFVGVGVGFVLGLVASAALWVGWTIWSPTDPTSGTSAPKPIVETQHTESSQVGGTQSPSSFQAAAHAATLEEMAQIETEFSQILALYNLALESSETQLLGLIDQTENLPIPFRFRSQDVFVDRLFEINPSLTLSQLENFDPGMSQSIFRQWARQNLDAAIAHAKSLEGAIRREASMGILTHRPDLSSELQARIARELGVEQLSDELSSGQQVTEIRRDPEKAWNETLRDGTHGSEKMQTLVITAVTWIRQSGLDVVDKINATLDGQAREEVLPSVFLSAMHFTEPEDVFRKALEIDKDPDSRLLSLVVGNWSESDPESALDAVNGIDSRLMRTPLLYTLLHNWARHEPRAVLSELDRFPTDMQTSAQEVAVKTIARSDPEEAISLIQDLRAGVDRTTLVAEIASIWAEQDSETALTWVLDNQESNQNRATLLSSVVISWSRRDPGAALNWVLNQRDLSDLRTRTLSSILRNLADENPELALQRALEQPIISDVDVGLEYAVINHVAHSDAQRAKAMLRRVREGKTRVDSYAAVGVGMIFSAHLDEAIELANDLKDSDRTKYFSRVLSNWVKHDVQGLLDRLEKFSDPGIQSMAAAKLIARDETSDILTDDQVELVKKYLTEDESQHPEHLIFR